MFNRRHRALATAFGIAAGLAPAGGRAQDLDVIMALPAATLTFTAAFVAEDAGFYKKEGLKVTHRTITGVGSPNAVLAGSADFTMGTGPVFLRAAAQGQRFLAIVNLVDRPLVELVLRKDVAEAAKITEAMPLAERAKALKGRTIGIQGVGSPMDPPSMLPALENKAIDGYVTSLPFTTQAVIKGHAVMVASAVTDAPDLIPFAYGLVYALPKTCKEQREKCARMARAMAGAARMIQEKPDEVFELLKKRFATMDPALLAAAWKVVAAAHAKDIRVTVAGLEAKLLEPKDALTSFEGLYTDEFVQ
jgi:ABC-type nitrate/sulfonate/bicarbonate transport system substrate-binding protein